MRPIDGDRDPDNEADHESVSEEWSWTAELMSADAENEQRHGEHRLELIDRPYFSRREGHRHFGLVDTRGIDPGPYKLQVAGRNPGDDRETTVSSMNDPVVILSQSSYDGMIDEVAGEDWQPSRSIAPLALYYSETQHFGFTPTEISDETVHLDCFEWTVDALGRIVRELDLIRDESAKPPAIYTEFVSRKVIQFHIHAALMRPLAEHAANAIFESELSELEILRRGLADRLVRLEYSEIDGEYPDVVAEVDFSGLPSQ